MMKVPKDGDQHFLFSCVIKAKLLESELIFMMIRYTVTKVHTGFDDATLDRLQTELGPNMEKIKQDFSKVPVSIYMYKNQNSYLPVLFFVNY